MKPIKLLCMIAMFLLLLCAAAYSSYAADDEEELFRAESDLYCSLLGDVDNDGSVTSSDARIILRVSTRLELINNARYNAYELDGATGISSEDARLALRISVNLDPRPAHAEAEKLELQEATCYEMGITAKKCVYCGELYDFGAIPMQPHTALGWEVVKNATCAEEGCREQYCIYCGIRINRETIPRIDHFYGPVCFVSETPDCTKAQEVYRECKVCGVKVFGFRLGTPHTYEWTTTNAPTCTAQGEQEKICSVCGMCSGETAVLPSLGGHIPSGWITIIAPSYTREGLRRIVCTRCGETLEEEVIPKRG